MILKNVVFEYSPGANLKDGIKPPHQPIGEVAITENTITLSYKTWPQRHIVLADVLIIERWIDEYRV